MIMPLWSSRLVFGFGSVSVMAILLLNYKFFEYKTKLRSKRLTIDNINSELEKQKEHIQKEGGLSQEE